MIKLSYECLACEFKTDVAYGAERLEFFKHNDNINEHEHKQSHTLNIQKWFDNNNESPPIIIKRY